MAGMSRMREAMRMVHGHEDEMLKMEFEHLHKRNDDLSVKAGAILGFGGLLIAATLVLMTAEPETALHTRADSIPSLTAAAGLLVLFAGAVLALLAIAMTQVYDENEAAALIDRLERRLKAREACWRWACSFTFMGSIVVGVAYVMVLAGNAFGLSM